MLKTHLKPKNKSLGHSIEDELLAQVAKRFEFIIRGDDTAARFGGDEFTVLLQEISNSQHATEVAERILNVMNEPLVCMAIALLYLQVSVL